MKTSTDPVLRLQTRITDRDWQLLDWLYDHGVLTTDQIAHALFPSLRIAQKRLNMLMDMKLVDRFRPLRPGGGSYPWSYVLGHTGAVLAAVSRDQATPRPAHTAARQRAIAASRNHAHTHGVHQFFTDLAGHGRLHPPARLHRWLSPHQTHHYTGPFQGTVKLEPDGFGIWDTEQARLGFFLEYDRGTEPHATLLQKLAWYADSFDFGAPPYPVLLWLHSERREHHLHQHILDHGRTILVATTATDRITPGTSPSGQIWAVPGRCGLHTLAGLYPYYLQQRTTWQLIHKQYTSMRDKIETWVAGAK